MQTLELPKKGTIVELVIEDLAFGGQGIAHIGEMVVFVRHGIPGQKVSARILKKRRSYLEAIRLDVLEESPHSAVVRCEHFVYCGGCSYQNLAYDRQVAAKERQVQEIFQRIGHFGDIPMEPILPCAAIYHYRNKMEFTFSNRRWTLPGEDPSAPVDFTLGLHVPGRYDKILNIDSCDLQHPVANEILATVKAEVKKLGLEPYDVKTHQGYLRNLILRSSAANEGIMVNIVTAWDEPERLRSLVRKLEQAFPAIVSIVNNVTSRRSGSAIGESERVLAGKDHIEEELGPYRFRISANSFFQTNTRQALRLYERVREACALTGTETLYDLFCGTGTIGIFVSDRARQVFGFELIPSAVADARKNAALNGVENIQFFEGDLMNALKREAGQGALPAPDVVIVDPPRAGLHPKTIRDILHLRPERIVYISCNPATQARDVNLLCEEAYTLVRLQPVDMFPHTPHVENIATLIRRKGEMAVMENVPMEEPHA